MDTKVGLWIQRWDCGYKGGTVDTKVGTVPKVVLDGDSKVLHDVRMAEGGRQLQLANYRLHRGVVELWKHAKFLDCYAGVQIQAHVHLSIRPFANLVAATDVLAHVHVLE